MKRIRINSVLSFLALMLTVTSEKCNRPPDDGTQCTYLVTIQDYSGLDGCGLLLVAKDGSKYLATNLESHLATPKDGDVLRIDYEEVDGMASICMAEKLIIRLTCLEVIEKGSDCPVILDPYRIRWSREVMTELDPRQVESAQLGELPVYRFTGQDEVRVYSCKGEQLCRYVHTERETCKEILERMRDVKIIYKVDE